MEIILEGNKLKTAEDFHTEIKHILKLPDYYGRNLDALWDCLNEIEMPLTLVWKNFEISRTNIESYVDKILLLFKEAENEIYGFKIRLL